MLWLIKSRSNCSHQSVSDRQHMSWIFWRGDFTHTPLSFLHRHTEQFSKTTAFLLSQLYADERGVDNPADHQATRLIQGFPDAKFIWKLLDTKSKMNLLLVLCSSRVSAWDNNLNLLIVGILNSPYSKLWCDLFCTWMNVFYKPEHQLVEGSVRFKCCFYICQNPFSEQATPTTPTFTPL